MGQVRSSPFSCCASGIGTSRCSASSMICARIDNAPFICSTAITVSCNCDRISITLLDAQLHKWRHGTSPIGISPNGCSGQRCSTRTLLCRWVKRLVDRRRLRDRRIHNPPCCWRRCHPATVAWRLHTLRTRTKSSDPPQHDSPKIRTRVVRNDAPDLAVLSFTNTARWVPYLVSNTAVTL